MDASDSARGGGVCGSQIDTPATNPKQDGNNEHGGILLIRPSSNLAGAKTRLMDLNQNPRGVDIREYDYKRITWLLWLNLQWEGGIGIFSIIVGERSRSFGESPPSDMRYVWVRRLASGFGSPQGQTGNWNLHILSLCRNLDLPWSSHHATIRRVQLSKPHS